MTIGHREACGGCAATLIFFHCNACHRLFLQCEGCEAVHADARQHDSPPGTPLPPPEHPSCPRCDGLDVRPATRSDLQVRGMLELGDAPGF